jgi:signal transduction histidine kinase
MRAHTRGTGVVIEVEDAGAGIAPEVVEHMFERRAPGARGTGIGLALARSLAEAHGGRLRLSRARPHPVFAVTLLAAPHEPAVEASGLSGSSQA